MRQKKRMVGDFRVLVNAITERIRQSRFRAAKSVNRELLSLCFQTGKLLVDRIASTDWGDAILEKISAGIQKTFPGIRGFSLSNLKNMRQFYRAYAGSVFSQLLTGQITEAEKSQLPTGRMAKPNFSPLTTATINKRAFPDDCFLKIGFTHHILLLQKCAGLDERLFYMQQTVQNQWSVEVLRYHIASNLYGKKGVLSSNFNKTLPETLKKHAIETFKDEYLLNFINVNEDDGEEVLENELVTNLRHFLMSLGREFAFLGNQYRVVVDDEEFFVDLLFYHRQLQSLIAIELKTTRFKPEYAGKMNFYLEALDQYVKLQHENPSIGIILCKEKKNTIVEFAFKRVDRPMGVATYVLDKKLPAQYQRYLPTPAQLIKAAVKGVR